MLYNVNIEKTRVLIPVLFQDDKVQEEIDVGKNEDDPQALLDLSVEIVKPDLLSSAVLNYKYI